MNEPKAKPIHQVVGENVSVARAYFGITAGALSLRMQERGLSWVAQRVYELEKGKKPVSLAELMVLASSLSSFGEEVTLEDLLSSDGAIALSAAAYMEPAQVQAALTGKEVRLTAQ